MKTQKNNIRLSSITCSDKRLDILDNIKLLDLPVNKYELKCRVCEFPNIDLIPNPYFIAKNRDFSGVEIMKADLGNLLISDRLKQIFEILFENQLVFFQTYILNSKITTKWWLAIPTNMIINGKVKNYVKKCKSCSEPLSAHPGYQYEFWIEDIESTFDIIKSKNWHSIDENDWKQSWIDRDILLSVRLISLLKRIKANGIYQFSNSKYKKLTEEEKKWVENSLIKIDKLSHPTKVEITKEDIEKFKGKYSVFETSISQKIIFEQKFKIIPNNIIELVLSLKSGTKIDLGFDEKFRVKDLHYWAITKSSPKLISFAIDEYGNELLFNPKDKKCSVYYFDHETMIYDLVKSSLIYI